MGSIAVKHHLHPVLFCVCGERILGTVPRSSWRSTKLQLTDEMRGFGALIDYDLHFLKRTRGIQVLNQTVTRSNHSHQGHMFEAMAGAVQTVRERGSRAEKD